MQVYAEKVTYAITAGNWYLVNYQGCVNGLVGQVLAGPLFLKVKTKLHFTESK